MPVAEMRQHARDVRLRLMRPPNAVQDLGIDLRRQRIPPPIKKKEPEVATAKVIVTEIVLPPKKLTIVSILRAVSNHYRVGTLDIKGKSRRPAVTYPRHVAIYLAYRLLKRSGASISREFGMDHTSGMYAKSKIEAILARPGLRAIHIQELEREIRAGHYCRSSVAAEPEFHLARGWPSCIQKPEVPSVD